MFGRLLEWEYIRNRGLAAAGVEGIIPKFVVKVMGMVGEHVIFFRNRCWTAPWWDPSSITCAWQMRSKDADVENILSRDKEMRLFLCNSLYSCICGWLSSQLVQLLKIVSILGPSLNLCNSMNIRRIAVIWTSMGAQLNGLSRGVFSFLALCKLTEKR
jgi:hypothetical protein